jgi:hypothetical protein
MIFLIRKTTKNSGSTIWEIADIINEIQTVIDRTKAVVPYDTQREFPN